METFLLSDQKVLKYFKAQVSRLEKKWSKSDMPNCNKLGYVKPWDMRLSLFEKDKLHYSGKWQRPLSHQVILPLGC